MDSDKLKIVEYINISGQDAMKNTIVNFYLPKIKNKSYRLIHLIIANLRVNRVTTTRNKITEWAVDKENRQNAHYH